MAVLVTVLCGTTIVLTVTFIDQDGNKYDPDEVIGKIRPPQDADIVDLDMTRDSVGVWSASFVPTLNGLHQYRLEGDGALNAADEGAFMAQTEFPT